MDVTVEDLMKANSKNKAVKNKNHIQAGGKLNLSFIKIEKSYTLGGGDLEMSIYAGGGGGITPFGKIQIVENKNVKNTYSNRKVHQKKTRTINYNSVEGGCGAAINFGKLYVGMEIGNFKNLDDAEDTFFLETEGDVAGFNILASLSKPSTKSGARWAFGGVGFSRSVIKGPNKAIEPKNVSRTFTKKINSTKDSVKSWVLNSGDRKNDDDFPSGWHN